MKPAPGVALFSSTHCPTGYAVPVPDPTPVAVKMSPAPAFVGAPMAAQSVEPAEAI